MSGLEILGAIASSIALVQAVKGTLKAVDFLRENSEMKKECSSLRREILMIECFIMQAQQQTDPMIPTERLMGSTGHPLVSLAVDELEGILNELSQIAEKYSHSRKARDPKRYTDKIKWFSEIGKIEELRERAQAIKSNLHMAITFRVSSMVDRGNMRQEALFHRVTQQLTSYTQQTQHVDYALRELPAASSTVSLSSTIAQKPGDEMVDESDVNDSPRLVKADIKTHNTLVTSKSFYSTVTRKEESFVSVTTIQPLSSRTCSLACRCRCHRNQSEYNGGAWAKSLLGSWLVRYEFSGNACKRSCGPNTGVKLEYQLPKWLWAGVVSFEACQGPKLNWSLRPRRVLPVGDSIYVALRQPLVLQEHINQGYSYFPDDTDQAGRNLLWYAMQQCCWDSIEILLKLWENILPHQGLPRALGYEIMSHRTFGDPAHQGELFSTILEKVLSFIPDWHEVRTTDIHMEAKNTSKTGEGRMLQALRRQPWAINELDENGYPPIHWAVTTANLDALDLLIMAKANINQLDYLGSTPLVFSVCCNEEEVTERLLEYEECRLHINDTSSSGYTALHHAIRQNSPSTVRMLLEAGATVKGYNTSVPIMRSFSSFSWWDQDTVDEILHLLIMHGANIEERDNYGMTPVMSATQNRNILALRSLISSGGSLHTTDAMNRNILHVMACHPSAEIIDYIAKQDLVGLEPEQRSTDSGSPLHTLHRCWRPFVVDPSHFFPGMSLAEITSFITFYFDLLILHLRRHMSTISHLLDAVKIRDTSAATKTISQLVEKSTKRKQKDLVGWYRGLNGYVLDGDWGRLADVLAEEYHETDDKIGRAEIASVKTITDPEMEEFF